MYFQLSGGIERWLYRLVRKNGAHQRGGWRFDFHHLHAKTGSQARFTDFALDLRRSAPRQSLPGDVLTWEPARNGERSETSQGSQEWVRKVKSGEVPKP